MRFLIVFKILVRILFVILNNLYCIPTFCLWMLLFQPLKYYKPNVYWKIEGMFFHWLLSMVSMWSWSAGYDIVEMGDDIRLCLEDKTLIIVNHQSTGDVPMLMASFNPKPGVLPNIMWIMDRVFKFTNFGIVSVLHEDFFVIAGKNHRDETIHALRSHLKESYLPRKRKLIVLFPEGGFLRKRREGSKRFAIKNNLPILTNVSLPRVGAMHAIVDVLAPNSKENDKKSDEIHQSTNQLDYNRLTWILDITIAYPEGKPLDLPTIVTGSRKPCQTYFLYRLYPSSDLPDDHEGVTNWLIARWEEKEKILQHFYQTGEVPVKEYCNAPLPAQVIVQDNLRFFLLHMFFIASSYFHVRLFILAFNIIWY